MTETLLGSLHDELTFMSVFSFLTNESSISSVTPSTSGGVTFLFRKERYCNELAK